MGNKREDHTRYHSACFAAFSGFVFAIVISMGTTRPAHATSDDDLTPSACQTINFAAVVVSEVEAIIIPPPLDLVPTVGAFSANLQLRLCRPKIVAPADLTKGDGFWTEDLDATSFNPEVDDPFVNDPACYASVPQSITQAEYENIFGFELFTDNWGGLGTPAVYHANTAVDVRLYAGPQPDDPETVGNESLRDAWPTFRAADGTTEVRIPVGKNRLVYRADTLVSPIDFAFIYIPSLPTTSKGFRELAKKSNRLRAAIVSGFKAFSKLDFITIPAGTMAIDQAIGLNWRHSQLGVIEDVFEDAYQEVWVFDSIPPVITTDTDVSALSPRSQAILSYDSERDVFYMESIHPGGILASTAVDLMEPLLHYNDRCGRQVQLTNNGGTEVWPTGNTIYLEWTVADPGPSNFAGHVNTASLTHTIEVRDTFPPVLLAPPSLVFELPAAQQNQTIDVNLGVPRVFDLADLTPEVTNDAAGTEFSLGLTEVTWTASDGVNSSTAVQLINVKEEGTNTPPVADVQQVETQSFAETEIILTGSDGDYHPGVDRYDPLTFSIVEQPQNGDLVAPLLPYFIEDVRLEASALRFAGNQMQQDPREYCKNAAPDALSFQQEYPRWPEWMAVNDAGNTIVYDFGSIVCDHGNGSTSFNPRLAIFDAAQNLVASQELLDGGTPTDIHWDQRTGLVYVARTSTQVPDTIDVFFADLTMLARYDLEAGPPETKTEGPVGVSVDSRGIMYVATNNKINAFEPLPNQPDVFLESLEIDAHTELLGTAWTADVYFSYNGIESIAHDSANNLYIGFPYHIVKVAAALVEESPFLFTPGEQIGWLGYCSSNLTNEYACDTVGQRSLGYSCSDTLCGRASESEIEPGQTPFSKPGQLNGAKGIAVDPKGVLYVADSGNNRIQRFTSDGAYGGEARSTGVGFGFLLGDFGFPTDIEVNSNHFYVLNRDSSLLHSFQTTPVTPIDDGSASVTYRSHNNFVGSDQFRFGVTDGFDSDEATVSISVTRNFRPPEIPENDLTFAAPPILEDTPRSFTVSGTDPDGDQDVLSVVVVVPPSNGTVEIDGLEVTYIPDPDYFGSDEFSYRVFDGTDTSEQVGTVSLTVEAVMDAPTLNVDEERTAKLGYRVRHPFDVTDPDPNEILTFTIDWGDGEMTGEGRFEIGGNPIPVDEVFNSDGTVRDGVIVTGPVLAGDPNGIASSVANHVYVTAGTYQITTCVYDQIAIDPVTQEKSLTAASQSTCGQTDVIVGLDAEVLIDIDGPMDELAKTSEAKFTITIRNLPFDIAEDDPRSTSLPGTGVDIFNLSVVGELPAGLELLDVNSDNAVCLSNGAEIECAIAALPYATDVTLALAARIAESAPGRAKLGLFFEGSWQGMGEAPYAAGIVTVMSTGQPPEMWGTVPAAARSDDYAVVTLQGRNFEAGARVFFGSRPGLQVDVIDSTMLTVQVPVAPPGVVDIIIVNPDGQTFELGNAWTYLETASPPSPDPNPRRRGGGGVDPLTLLGFLTLLTILRLRKRFGRTGSHAR